MLNMDPHKPSSSSIHRASTGTELLMMYDLWDHRVSAGFASGHSSRTPEYQSWWDKEISWVESRSRMDEVGSLSEDEPMKSSEDEPVNPIEDEPASPIKDELYTGLTEALIEDTTSIGSSSSTTPMDELESYLRVLTFDQNRATPLM